MIGESIGHYQIEKKLGEGGVGEVYRAHDCVLERAVALKRLRPELARRRDVVERFRAEARTLAQLNHPNIATLHAFECDGDQWVMVMEYVEGETVSELLRRRGRLELAEALPIFLQALDGLGFAHDRGIVHRDIKGSNLIVMPGGLVKIMDFGIARVLGAERLTLLGHPVGTPEYMAPEQIRGDEIDARADIYAAGSLFYALLCGEPPFSGRSDYELMRAQIEADPPPLSDRVAGLPETVVRAIDCALAKHPEERFSSTLEFREALACEPEPATPWRLGHPTTFPGGLVAQPAPMGRGLAIARADESTRVLSEGEPIRGAHASAQRSAPSRGTGDTRTLLGPGGRPWRVGFGLVSAAAALLAGLNWLTTTDSAIHTPFSSGIPPAVATEPVPAIVSPAPGPVEAPLQTAALESDAVEPAPISPPAPAPRPKPVSRKAQPRRVSADEKRAPAPTPAGTREDVPTRPRRDEAASLPQEDAGPRRHVEGWVIRRQ